MKKIIIRKLGVASIARIMGVAHAIWGFVVGFLAMFGGISAIVVQPHWFIAVKIAASVGVVLFALIIIPIASFIFGWLYGAVLSLIANLFLHTANGIELDIDDDVTGRKA